MKKTTLLLLSALALSACHDDNTAPSTPLGEKTFDSSSGLQLSYDGAPMPGKTVTFSQNGDNATISAFSDFDLSQLSQFGLSGKIPAPGVIPGSPRITVTAPLVESDGGWSFSGNSKNDFCTFSYSGFASDNGMKLSIEDVKLINPVTPEIWVPAPIEKNDDGSFKSLPFYIDWQFNPLPDVDIDLNGILTALTTLPMIPVYNNTAYMSVSQAMTEVLRAVAFKEDGNILFTYINDSFGSARIDQTQPNGYQYAITAPGTVKLYVNPLSFFGLLLNNGSVGTPSSEVDLNAHGLFPAKTTEAAGASTSSILESELGKEALKNVMEYLLPQLATGFPLSFTTDDAGMHIFIDTDTAITIFSKIMLPLIQDSPTVEKIEQYIATHPTLSPLLPELKKGIEALPAALERTTTFRFGFNFLPYSPAK